MESDNSLLYIVGNLLAGQLHPGDQLIDQCILIGKEIVRRVQLEGSASEIQRCDDARQKQEITALRALNEQLTRDLEAERRNRRRITASVNEAFGAPAQEPPKVEPALSTSWQTGEKL